MKLRQLFSKLNEGGNLSVGGHEAQHIDLKVHNRAYIVPILDTLLQSINNAYAQQFGSALWNPKLLKSREFLSGSSLHFFNTDIPDEEFIKVKPKVGDIDTQVNKEAETNIEQFLNASQGKVIGNAKFLGFSRGNEQFSSLWELTDPPIKVQIDLEFVKFEKDKPTAWSAFSHSSSWDDLSQGIKGVFHKFLIQSFTKLTEKEFLLRKMVGRGKARVEQDVPTTDNMLSFAVSSKEGGGLRPKYEPVLDEKGRPLEINGMPVMKSLAASGYEQDIGAIFQSIFGKRINGPALKKVLPKTWSFVGLLEIMNMILEPDEKEHVVDAFVNKLFAPGAQGLYKGDPQRDVTEKNAALNYALKILQVAAPANLEQMRQDYTKNYRVATEGPIGLDRPIDEADEAPKVQAQLRKGMPHLRDLKPADFLDLLDEIQDENGGFKLQNIPLNVKIDGFGGRFGKNAEGKPFMGTSRTEPRYSAGFLDYHKQKGTDDPEILGRAANFDKLFNEIMAAIQLVDKKLGPDYLVDKQVTCEVLFLPFATQTDEGKLKFVGIEYDQLPKGVDLVLVPYNIVEASTGKKVPNEDEVVQKIAELGQGGNVMFMSNRLAQKEGLDVTEIINPLENIDELKRIVSDTAGKRDRASLELRKEVEAKLKPVQIELEKAIDNDPNIVGKDMLGQDYEGIVINSRLGPIKVTSQRQKDLIAQKQAAKAAARAEHPRENSNKTAVVAIGSFVGHKGHEELFNFTINKAKEVGGDPYLFIGNAVGKDDPIPPDVKVQTWHKMYPAYAKNISTVQVGGSIMQKIKHELINPLPGKPPRYDNIIIMVGEDQANMPIANALMKAVNKFQGYEHVKASLEVTPRGTGMSFTKLRNILKDPNATPEQQYAVWAGGFDEAKLGKDWILHLMDITRKGMGITQQPKQPAPVAERLFTALIRPRLNEMVGPNDRVYHSGQEYDEDKSSQVAEFLHELQPNLFSRYGDEFVMNTIEKVCRLNPQASVTQCAGDVIRHLKSSVDEARMSAAVKLQRAFDRERAKSDASRRRGEEVMAQAKKDAEKKSKEQGVAEESDKQFAQRMKKQAEQPPTKGMSQKEKVAKGWAHPDTLKKEDWEQDKSHIEAVEKFTEYARERLANTKTDLLDDMAKKLSAIEEKHFGAERKPTFTPIVLKLLRAEKIERDKPEPDSPSHVNTPFGSISGGPDTREEVYYLTTPEMRELFADLKNAGVIKDIKEFKKLDALIKAHSNDPDFPGWDIQTPMLTQYIDFAKKYLGKDVNEDWQKVNKHDKTDGMSSKAVKAYRRENPGSKLKTAVTTKPSKLKKGSKASKRRASFCARMSGMKKAHASAKTKRDPDSPINKALRRWNCESVEELQSVLEALQEQLATEGKIKGVDGKACWKGKRYAGKVKKADGTYKDKCVPVNEDIEDTMASLIEKIIVNEAIQSNKR